MFAQREVAGSTARPGTARRRALATLLGMTLTLGSAPSAGTVHAKAGGDGARSISGKSPFPETCDPPAQVDGAKHFESQPHLAVNPMDSDNIAVSWTQDNSDGIVVGVSHDGGDTWTKNIPPETSVCADGDYTSAQNTHLSFGPEGRLYLSTWNNDFTTFDAITVHASGDGGDTWSPPVSVKETFIIDSESTDHFSWVVADPTQPGTVYATWHTLDDTQVIENFTAREMGFARSTDGGATWSELDISPAPTGQDRWLPQLVVLPDGSLVNVFLQGPDAPITNGRRRGRVMAARSTDGGDTWSQPARVAERRVAADSDPRVQNLGMGADHALVNVPAVSDDGTIYYAWPSNEPDSSKIYLTSSSDGGSSWAPARVIRESDALMAAVNITVGPNGRLGVLFYELRNNDPDDGATEVRFMSAPRSSDDPAAWKERHVAGPFDINSMPSCACNIGANQGLAGTQVGFVAAYTLGNDAADTPLQYPPSGLTDIFFSRLRK